MVARGFLPPLRFAISDSCAEKSGNACRSEQACGGWANIGLERRVNRRPRFGQLPLVDFFLVWERFPFTPGFLLTVARAGTNYAVEETRFPNVVGRHHVSCFRVSEEWTLKDIDRTGHPRTGHQVEGNTARN